MDTIQVSIIMLVCWQLSSQSEQMCSRGHRFQISQDGRAVCVQCADRVNFMPSESHTNKNCYNCTRIEHPDLEILTTECNISHDSEILCQQEYYRYQARNNREKNECKKCTQCNDILRVCRGYHDSVCCPADQIAVMVRNDVTFCQKRSTVCGPGQYVNTTADVCLPCPNGTYMYDYNHTHTSCYSCVSLNADPTFNSAIVQDCNTTSPTVFGCKDGYFRSILADPLTVEVKCYPCQRCEREIRHCDMYHDTICYGDDHVVQETVVVLESKSEDKFQGFSQVPTIPTTSTCGDGHYLHVNNSDGSTNCQSCDDLQLEGLSHTRILNQTFKDPVFICQAKIQKYRIYSIILFIFAFLIDILFIFLYSRHFLKKTSNFPKRNSTANSDKISHVFGTIAMDVHFVLTFIHLFGILCESGVISMDEDILWTFTIAVVITSVLIYLTDAAVFLYLKHIISISACFRRKCLNAKCHFTSGNYEDGDDDDATLTIIESEVI